MYIEVWMVKPLSASCVNTVVACSIRLHLTTEVKCSEKIDTHRTRNRKLTLCGLRLFYGLASHSFSIQRANKERLTRQECYLQETARVGSLLHQDLRVQSYKPVLFCLSRWHTTFMIGPRINVLNTGSVCMYTKMYACMYSYVVS